MNELRICKTNIDLINKFKAISKDKFETTSETMRPILREISESFSEEVFIECEKGEFKMSGISDTIIRKFDIHAKKIGITTEQLLRLKLYEWLEKQDDFTRSLY